MNADRLETATLTSRRQRGRLALHRVSACAKDGVAGDKTGRTRTPRPRPTPPSPSKSRKPVRGEMLAMYSGTATLEAEADAEVIAKVGGEVRAHPRRGRRPREGRPGARASRSIASCGCRPRRPRAALAKAERDFNRQVELHEKGLVSAGAFEGLKYDLDTQRAANDLARLKLSLQRDSRAVRRHRLAQRHVKLGNRINANEPAVSRHGSHAAEGSVYVPERELATPQARPGGIDQRRRPRRRSLPGHREAAYQPDGRRRHGDVQGDARSQRSEGRSQARHVRARRHRVRTPHRGADDSAHRDARHRRRFERVRRERRQGRAARHQDRTHQCRQGRSDSKDSRAPSRWSSSARTASRTAIRSASSS